MGRNCPLKKNSGNVRDPHEYKAEGQHSHYDHYSTHNPATFSESRDDGSGRANLHADAVDEKNLRGYVRNSGISGKVGVEANTGAGFSHSHSPESVGIPSHSVTDSCLPENDRPSTFSESREDSGETARVYDAILQLNGRPVDGLRFAELLGRSVEPITPALDELARRGLIRPKGVSWLTSPVILLEAGGKR